MVKAECEEIIVAEEMRGLHPEVNCPFSWQLWTHQRWLFHHCWHPSYQISRPISPVLLYLLEGSPRAKPARKTFYMSSNLGSSLNFSSYKNCKGSSFLWALMPLLPWWCTQIDLYHTSVGRKAKENFSLAGQVTSWCCKLEGNQGREHTWKHRRRASSPREFLRLEKPQSISLMSTVPSRLLSNRSKMRGAIGISDDMFIAFSTSSNLDRVALSPFAHLHINISLD